MFAAGCLLWFGVTLIVLGWCILKLELLVWTFLGCLLWYWFAYGIAHVWMVLLFVFRCFPVDFGCLWLVVSGVFDCSVCVCFVRLAV